MTTCARRPSPGTVIAIVALVVALDGNAIAAEVHAVIERLKPNSVTSVTVKDGTLLLKDFKASQRSKLIGPAGAPGPRGAPGQPGDPGPPGITDAYTKAQSDAQYLAVGGTAANAQELDGIDSTGFVQGGGTDVYGLLSKPVGAASSVLDNVPELGQISVSCQAGGGSSDGLVAYQNTSSRTTSLTYAITHSGAATTITSVSIAPGLGLTFAPDAGATQMVIQLGFQVAGLGQSPATASATILLTDIPDPPGAAGTCRFQSQVLAAAKGTPRPGL